LLGVAGGGRAPKKSSSKQPQSTAQLSFPFYIFALPSFGIPKSFHNSLALFTFSL
jgi:hypothetical protein